MSPPSAAVGVLVALAAGACTSALAQTATPLHLLTHEWAQGFAVLLLGAVSVTGLREAQRQEPALAAARTLLYGLLGSLGALLGHLAWNAGLHGCRTGGAPLFFWSTVLPIVMLATVLGVAASRAARPWRVLVGGLLALVVACVVHDVGQALSGIRLVDPIIGELLALDQRADMSLRPVHLAQRAWLAAASAALWWGLSARWSPSAATLLRARVGAAAVLGATLLGGSHLGLGWSHAALRSELDGVLLTEHFELRYRAGGQAALHVDAIAEEAEWQLHRLAEAWDHEHPVRIRLNIYDNFGELRRISGGSSARAGLNWVDLRWWDAFDDTLAHELVHAIHWSAWPNPLIVGSRFHLEGTAVAWAEDLTVLPEAHRETAGALASDKLPPLAALLSPTGFVDLPERIAYDASGSAIGFVVQRYGWEALFTWQRTLSTEAATGKTVAALDAEWRAFLREVPTKLADVAKARERFDTTLWPSYRDRRCPKLGRPTEVAHARAERLLRVGHPAAALALYEEMLANKSKPQWVHEAARALAELGRLEEARTLLTEGRDDAPEDQVAKLWDLERLLALRERDWPRVEAALLARLAQEPDQEQLSTLLEVLTQESIREDVAEALLAARNEETGDRLLTLAQAHPELESLRRLALGHLVLSTQPYRRVLSRDDAQRLERFLELLDVVPEACDSRRKQLGSVGRQLARGGELGQAAHIADALATACAHPRANLHGQLLRDRLAWLASRSE